MVSKKNMLFCPIHMACDVLQPRWVIQILAEMWWGTTRFNDFRRALPGISPSLLSKRLSELEAQGLVERVADSATGSVDYLRTPAAVDLEPILEALGQWAYRHAGTQNELCNADARAFVWNLRRSINSDALPPRRVVIRLIFPDQEAAVQDFWITVRPGAPVDVCYVDPGYDVDLFVTAELETLLSVYFGHSRLNHEIDAGRISLIGSAPIARTVDRWLMMSSHARARIKSDLTQGNTAVKV